MTLVQSLNARPLAGVDAKKDSERLGEDIRFRLDLSLSTPGAARWGIDHFNYN